MQRFLKVKKYTVFLLIFLLVCLSSAGCGKSGNSSQDSSAPADNVKQTADDSDVVPDTQPAQNGSFSAAYSAYVETKSDLITRMADGLTDSQPAAAMELLGMNMVEMFMIPMAAVGLDETHAKETLAYLNTSGVKYTAEGNHYLLTYSDAQGSEVTCDTLYDPKKDTVATKIMEAGKESLVFEYTKTSYGYASQYYLKNDDGTYIVYQGTFYGKDGTVGVINNAAAQPGSILGKEVQKDFPKACDSWYEAEGSEGKGKTADGAVLTFTVPAKASN